MAVTYRNFKDMSHCIKKNISKLPKDIDLFVGIPRSGIIPAYMLALFLNKPVCSLDELINNVEPSSGERPLAQAENKKKKIFIVDDSIHSGHALKDTKLRLESIDTSKYEIKFLVIYGRKQTVDLVDYCFEVLPCPRIFQWNYLNHGIVEKSCVDIDGVLCADPTKEENDDGEKYIDFIRNARPLYIPRYEINSLVTSRLEKYRPQTEEWLKNNNIKYKNLFMLDLPSKEERLKRDAHIRFKADTFKNMKDTVLFIESNDKQAFEIALITNKPCICVETDTMYNSKAIKSKGKYKYYFKKASILLKRYGLGYMLKRIAKKLVKRAKSGGKKPK